MNDSDQELLDEIPKIVQISYIEIMLEELFLQQQEALNELNNFKEYTNKKLSLLEKRLFKIINAAKSANEGLEKLKEFEGIKSVRGDQS
ncbi:hypothetical protein [Falsibacillus albus]|uniref:Uncharacterized protein n=1 Tax=Falsibacillus albus TaxID=2478915 RepID=A0A3L7JHP6_9BACI|nr:hypothetical protein [Falsibacillus albus]RLQ89994.1 hypothetical protein D9X91_21925 [Falsibacillus albus]